MSHCPFCNHDSATGSTGPKPIPTGGSAGLFHRAWRSIQWLFPAALLVLIPKCPLCVVAYVALFTGVGITVSTARWIQVLMLACCSAYLVYFFIRNWRNHGHARTPRQSSAI